MTFSRSGKKKLRGEVPDVFQYSEFPNEFRVQVVHILRDALGDYHSYRGNAKEVYKIIHDILCREYGVFHLSEEAKYSNPDYQSAVFNFLLKSEDYERVIDVIEISFRLVDAVARDYPYRNDTNPRIEPDDAIDELNARFYEHGIGYQFESRNIVRVDSKFTHSEVIKPVLIILTKEMYEGANDEFLKAHKNYRHRKYKECLAECLKAFESTMKAICDKRKWNYKSRDTAKRLLNVCFQNELIPTYLQSHFSSLRSTLESGIPTIRNRLAGHGQGTKSKNVPDYFASYSLNLTAAAILFLAKAEESLN